LDILSIFIIVYLISYPAYFVIKYRFLRCPVVVYQQLVELCMQQPKIIKTDDVILYFSYYLQLEVKNKLIKVVGFKSYLMLPLSE